MTYRCRVTLKGKCTIRRKNKDKITKKGNRLNKYLTSRWVKQMMTSVNRTSRTSRAKPKASHKLIWISRDNSRDNNNQLTIKGNSRRSRGRGSKRGNRVKKTKNSSREAIGRTITSKGTRSTSKNKMLKKTKGNRKTCRMTNLLRKYPTSKPMMVKISRKTKRNKTNKWTQKRTMRIQANPTKSARDNRNNKSKSKTTKPPCRNRTASRLLSNSSHKRNKLKIKNNTSAHTVVKTIRSRTTILCMSNNSNIPNRTWAKVKRMPKGKRVKGREALASLCIL